MTTYDTYLDVQDESVSLHSEIAVDAGVLVEAKDVDVLRDERVSETVGQAAQTTDEAQSPEARHLALLQILRHLELDVCAQQGTRVIFISGPFLVVLNEVIHNWSPPRCP